LLGLHTALVVLEVEGVDAKLGLQARALETPRYRVRTTPPLMRPPNNKTGENAVVL
jgi:hypothetical protein